eukprot:6526033-Prymnesium_polylepis.1
MRRPSARALQNRPRALSTGRPWRLAGPLNGGAWPQVNNAQGSAAVSDGTTWHGRALGDTARLWGVTEGALHGAVVKRTLEIRGVAEEVLLKPPEAAIMCAAFAKS